MYSYFSILGLSQSFDLDQAALENAYLAAQRECHPDRFVNAPAGERIKSLQMATSVNQAYETLKNPFKRAEYLLRLHGVNIPAPGQDILEEALEKREALEEDGSVSGLNYLEEESAKDISSCLEKLRASFAAGDFNGAALAASRLQYLHKFAGEIRLKKAKGILHDAA